MGKVKSKVAVLKGYGRGAAGVCGRGEGLNQTINAVFCFYFSNATRLLLVESRFAVSLALTNTHALIRFVHT